MGGGDLIAMNGGALASVEGLAWKAGPAGVDKPPCSHRWMGRKK